MEAMICSISVGNKKEYINLLYFCPSAKKKIHEDASGRTLLISGTARRDAVQRQRQRSFRSGHRSSVIAFPTLSS
jgi:hypothetical protein